MLFWSQLKNPSFSSQISFYTYSFLLSHVASCSITVLFSFYNTFIQNSYILEWISH